MRRILRATLGWAAGMLAAAWCWASPYGPRTSVPNWPVEQPVLSKPRNLIDQTREEAFHKSRGCLECHAGIEDMHASPHVVLGCVDCHGGDPTPGLTMRQAHVAPQNPVFWQSSANPADSSVLLNHESPEFIRFVNPGDLRVAEQACGQCHQPIINNVWHSMMNHGAMLWGAAAYNNGAAPLKNYRFGQVYGPYGVPLKLVSPIEVTPEMERKHGILPFIIPLPRFHVGHPGNIFRIFEKGGTRLLELGIPDPFEPPGRPLRRLSERGLGTLNRIDPVILNAQKTRLNDPLLGFMGSNDHPGDYRSSGCTACHVVYANDRSPTHSGWWSKYGHQGLSFSGDTAIPKNERGHPIVHQFTRSIPSSQCMICHMHQGNLFVNPYLGYTWWDQESDGEFMYPAEQKDPTEEEIAALIRRTPEAAAARGLWGDPDFLEKVAELNPKLKHTQFADYHGHGWVFRAVFKKDRQGNFLDAEGRPIDHDDPQKFAKAVHLKDAHLAKGMHCVDCHFDVDVHGNGLLYGEPRAATSIECIDCHGTITARPTLITSGNSGIFNRQTGKVEPVDLSKTTTPWGPRFFWRGNRLFQRSMLSPDVIWEIPQTIDTINPDSPHYNEKSRYAKTLRRDGQTWGDVPPKEECARELAHDDSNIGCAICHTSWATSCFGCHLPMRANKRVPTNKYEGTMSRNYTTYNPQVVRDDVFQLGIDATYKNHRLAVIRSSSAVVVSSQNANREWVYSQQQTVSWEGYSGQAYNPHFAHTTSGKGTTKTCTDCHLSAANDNNAWMASLLGFGTGTVNFFGRYAYVGAGRGGFYAIVWTEQEEPQAAIGSYLHRLAYPRNYRQHEEAGRVLSTAYHHHATDIQDVVLRGEYLYTANGPDGFQVFDVANVDNKGFSERIVTSPVSPLGQRTYVKTRYATSVALPSTLLNDPMRVRLPENEEQPIHPLYNYAFITDLEEGLVIVNVATLFDGNPENNFLKKDLAYNPDGKLTGARAAYVAGATLYLVAQRGLFVININDPLNPQLVAEVTGFRNPRAIAVQFRYAFVSDDDGVKVVRLDDLKIVATVPLAQAGRLYAARTYLYVPNGAQGLAIVDITNPEQPRLDQEFRELTDCRAVQIGSVNASMFALVADGNNGFAVVQLISPDTVPGYQGFSPRPAPKLIARYPIRSGEAVAVSRGLDRDRVVDETGNQTVVFGRRGSRPLNVAEMNKLLRHADGALFTVTDDPPAQPPRQFRPPAEPAAATAQRMRIPRRPHD
ncbi:MAG: hypothetical protein RMM51_06850 [Verrucomicrobiae bacterium]|nr:hypothetical protein [Verrucomicrobiae bacterium]